MIIKTMMAPKELRNGWSLNKNKNETDRLDWLEVRNPDARRDA
jgi:hypothetical protein